MPDLVARAGRRTWQRHPWLVVLAVLGVALGVALVVGVDLANQSARTAFQRSVAVLSGPVTHRIEPTTGTLDQQWYAQLRSRESTLAMAPVVTGNVLVGWRQQAGRTRLRLLGVDPLAEQALRPAFGLVGLGGGGEGEGSGADLGDLILATEAPWPVVVTTDTARRRGWSAGDTASLAVSGLRSSVRIAAVLDPADPATRSALDDLLLSDIGAAQQLTGNQGAISRVDLALASADREAVLTRLRSHLPAGAVLVATRGEQDVLDQLTGAFQLNLQALGMLSLLVGVVLIIGVINVLTVQRRETFGLLRALGVPGRRLVADILWEAAALGAVGGLIGTALGILIAQPLTWAVTATIDDLYTRLSVRAVQVDAGVLAGVWLLAVLVAVLGAVPAAAEVARASTQSVRTRSSGERRAWRGALLAAAAGAPLGLTGAVVLVVSSGMIAGWIGTVACILAALCGVPLAVVGSVQVLRAVVGKGPLSGVVLGGISRYLSRTGLAATALVLALGTGIGVALMVASFRTTVVDWLQATLGADIYIAVADQRPSDPPAPLPEGVLAQVRAAVPDAAQVTSAVVDLPVGSSAITSADVAERIRVVVLGMDAGTTYRLPLAAGPDDLWDTFHLGGCAITEVLASKRGWAVGDSVVLSGVAVPVRAVIRDFTPDQGRIYMHREVFTRHWPPPPEVGVALVLPDGAAMAKDVAAGLRQRLAEYAVDVQPAQELRATSLRFFDRTFRVTGILQILTTAIAALAVATTALALRLERRGEMALLRAHGAGRRTVARLQRLSLLVLGGISGLLAVPVGYGMAWLLAGVINRRSFGWALEVSWSWSPVLIALLLAVGAAWVASLAPGGRERRALIRDLQEEL